MFRRSLYVATSLLVLMGMLGVVAPAAALTSKHAIGRVIAMNRRTHVMTVRTSLGTRVKLKYNSTTTKIYRNGVLLSLRRLHVGNKVDAAYTPSTTSTTIAGTATTTDDDMGLFEVSGTVAAIDTTSTPNTISIATAYGGSTVILKVNSSTVITRNGAPATLADLAFGDQVEAKYDSNTMIASFIKAEDDVENGEVEGTITAVGSNTITISGEGDDGGSSTEDTVPMDVTLNITSSTKIMLDGNPVALSLLAVGQQAEAQFDPATMNAIFVDAESQSE